MNRFYIDPSQIDASVGVVELRSREALKHIAKVLRLVEGDQVEIATGRAASYLATIERLSLDRAQLRLDGPLASRELPLIVDLFQGLPKGPKWDYLIQKSVEAGVHDIYPVQMQRSVAVVKADAAAKKTARWQKIAQQAAMQAKRDYLTQIKQPRDLAQAIRLSDQYDLLLIAYELEQTTLLKHLQRDVAKAAKIAIWIGPEGGLADSEVAALRAVGRTISLGKRIYRTESAAFALLAQIGYIVEQ